MPGVPRANGMECLPPEPGELVGTGFGVFFVLAGLIGMAYFYFYWSPDRDAGLLVSLGLLLFGGQLHIASVK
jgi:hypothetical protein